RLLPRRHYALSPDAHPFRAGGEPGRGRAPFPARPLSRGRFRLFDWDRRSDRARRPVRRLDPRELSALHRDSPASRSRARPRRFAPDNLTTRIPALRGTSVGDVDTEVWPKDRLAWRHLLRSLFVHQPPA